MYCTLDDLKKRITEDELLRLTDEHELGAIDQTIVDEAIEAAGIEIDSYLGKRFDLPLNPLPGVVANLAKSIAIFNLYGRSQEGPSDHWQKRYESSVALLSMIAAGDVSMGNEDPDASNDDVQLSGADRIFSRTSMKGY